METTENDAVAVSALLGTAGIAAAVAGVFGLITLFIKRIWAKMDEKKGWRKEMQESISKIDAALSAHITADDERNAVQCRTRILRFADELINEPKHLHTQGNFEQCLQDITVYDQYCADHPKFRNELTLRATEIIRKVYDECAREHKFL